MKTHKYEPGSRGFTLLEVIVSLLILSLVVASVFYFFSTSMENQQKLREKYRWLRVCRQAVDSFSQHIGEDEGRDEKENCLIEWKIYPAEERRRVPYLGGRSFYCRLILVHLVVTDKKGKEGENRREFNFLVNRVSQSRPGR